MKRFYAYLVAAFALTAVSCSTDATEEVTPAEPVQTGTVEMTFSASNDETRTLLDYDNRQTLWTDGDTISILDDQGGNNEFTIKEHDGVSAIFTGKVNEGATKFVAVYPYNAAYSWDGTTISGVEIPAAQTCTAGSFPEESNITVAVADENYSLAFKNVCSIIKFQVSTACESVTFASNGTEAVAGTVGVTLDGENIPTATATAAATSIALTCEGGFQPETNYFFVSVPNTFATGITVKVAGLVSKTTAKEQLFNRSTIKSLGTIPSKVVNLVPNSNWKQDNARFAAYLFINNGAATWVDMSDPDGDGTYSCLVPEDNAYTAAIFCRMNPSTTTNDWEEYNKWNQTQDMYFSDQRGSNTCTILSSTNVWDGGGYWKLESKYVYLYPNDNWRATDGSTGKSPWFTGYFWGSSANKFVKLEQEGGSSNTTGASIYRIVPPSGYTTGLIFCRMDANQTAANWNNVWNQTSDLKPANSYGKVYIPTGWSKEGGTYIAK